MREYICQAIKVEQMHLLFLEHHTGEHSAHSILSVNYKTLSTPSVTSIPTLSPWFTFLSSLFFYICFNFKHAAASTFKLHTVCNSLLNKLLHTKTILPYLVSKSLSITKHGKVLIFWSTPYGLLEVAFH